MAKDDLALVTFEMDKESYFNMMKVCLERKQTIDEFVTAALKDFIAKNKTLTKKKKK